MPRSMPSPSPDLKQSSQPMDPRQQYRPMTTSQSNSGSFVSLNEAAVILYYTRNKMIMKL